MYNEKSRINFFGEAGIQILILHQISRSDFQISRSIQINPDETNRAPPPSIWTVGKNGRRMYWSIERSSRRWGAVPPYQEWWDKTKCSRDYRIQILTLHQISRSDFQISRTWQFNPDETNRAPPPSILTVGKNGRMMYWSIERSSAVGGRTPLSIMMR